MDASKISFYDALKLLTTDLKGNLKNYLKKYFRKNLVRDKVIVKKEYNDTNWAKVLAEKKWLKFTNIYDYLTTIDDSTRVALIDNNLVKISTNNYYKWRLKKIQETISLNVKNSQELVELGCGYGYNIFSLSMLNQWQLTGMDISPLGTQAGKEIANHFGITGINFEICDLINPDNSTLKKIEGKNVFTYHAMEQLKRYTGVVIENILRARPARVIRFEPTTENLSIFSLRDLNNFFYIKAMDYQDNLLKTLNENRDIKILTNKRLYFAPLHRHDHNLIVWEPK